VDSGKRAVAMRTMATLRVFGGGDKTARHVTDVLHIEPTEAFEVGEPSGRPGVRPHARSGWLLKSSAGPAEVELGRSLQLLLDRVEPASASLWALERDGYRVNWFCYVGSNEAEHAAELDRATLQRLIALPGDLWLDVYPGERAS
jgi:hypothetical protein